MTIYVVEASARVKIGYTADLEPRRRVKSLQTGCPSRIKIVGFCPGDASGEHLIHGLIKGVAPQSWLGGEWFSTGSHCVREFVEAIKSDALAACIVRYQNKLAAKQYEIANEQDQSDAPVLRVLAFNERLLTQPAFAADFIEWMVSKGLCPVSARTYLYCGAVGLSKSAIRKHEAKCSPFLLRRLQSQLSRLEPIASEWQSAWFRRVALLEECEINEGAGQKSAA